MNLNTKLILIFIFGAIATALFSIPVKAASGAELSLFPNNLLARQGEEFVLTVMLNTNNDLVNVVSADLIYPQNQLQVLGIDSSNSILGSVADENFTKPGVINLSRFLTAGRFYNGNGEIAKIKFRVLHDGISEVKFTDNTAVINSNTLNILTKRQSSTIKTFYDFKSHFPINLESSVKNVSNQKPWIILTIFGFFILIFVITLIVKFLKKNQPHETKYLPNV
ncbi:MAG: cohesin domain-containing protein [bacterium]